jgi:hypothetical protein
MPSGYCIYHQPSRSETLLSAHRMHIYTFPAIPPAKWDYFPRTELNPVGLYTHNRDSVYCPVRTDSLSIIGVKFCLWRGAIAHAVSRRPSPRILRIRSQARPCEICSGQSGTGISFSLSTAGFFPIIITPPVPHTRSSTRRYQKDNGRRLGAFQKAVLFGNRGAFDRKVLTIFFFQCLKAYRNTGLVKIMLTLQL